MRQGFVILTRERETPSLAKCGRCQIKFFAPKRIGGHPLSAEEYLWQRYLAHECKAAEEMFPSRVESTA